MASPAARHLALRHGDPASVFALFGRVGRSPRVYASRDRDTLLRQMQASALRHMGLTLAGEHLWWERSLRLERFLDI
jgi:DnaJ family protein C protein 13